MSERQFKVLPKPPLPLTDHFSRRPQLLRREFSDGEMGCLKFALLYLVVVGGAGFMWDAGAFLIGVGVSGVIVLAVLPSFIFRYMKDISNYHDQRARRKSELKNRAITEAEDTTIQVLAALAQSEELARSVPSFLEKARDSLSLAEKEFSERAFGPFWDAIESCAGHLDRYNSSISQLARSASLYYSLLRDREHSFPSLQVSVRGLPSPRPLLTELRAWARKGQKDFEFALIWEQRQTRRVLIVGFDRLGSALYNIGGVIDASLGQLESTFKSEAAKVVEGQSATREGVEAVGEKLEDLHSEIKRQG